MRLVHLVAIALLSFSSAAFAQELRINPDGTTFSVHIDPRARPRMSADDLIEMADEAQRGLDSSLSDRATILRIDLALAEDVRLIIPEAPFQETQRGRWVWAVRLLGRFEGGGGPKLPESEGREGWFLVDDGSGAAFAWGFKREKVKSSTPAPNEAAAAAAACERHYAAMEHTVRPEHLNNTDVTGARALWRVREVNRAGGLFSPPHHAEQTIWVETGFQSGDWVETGVTEGKLLNSPFPVGDWYYSGRNTGGLGGFYSEGHFLLNGQPVARVASDIGRNLEFKAVSCKRMEPGCTSADPNTVAACISPIQNQRLCIQWAQVPPGTNHWIVGLEATCQGSRVDATYVRESQYRFNATSVNPPGLPTAIKIRPVDTNIDILMCSQTNFQQYRYWMNPLNNKAVCGQ